MKILTSSLCFCLLLAAATGGVADAKKLYGYTSSGTQTKTAKAAGSSSGKSSKAAKNAQMSAEKTKAISAAMQKYATGKYKDSAESLEYIDGHGGCCDKVHYFLALNYQNLNQTVLSQMHYQWVSSNSKDARLRQFAATGSDTLAYYQSHRTYGGQGGATPIAMSFG